jgi:tyrosine-protein phosphatase SIW14
VPVSSTIARIALAAVLTSSLEPAVARAQSPAAAAVASPAAKVRIYNFGQVNSSYFRGSLPEARDIAALKALGIRTVIDLQKDGDDDEPDLIEAAGMRYVNIPMTTRETPTAEKVAAFLAIVSDPASLPVYVHCKEGRHRTGVMTAAYRMANEGWTPQQAFKEMKAYKFGWDFLHPEFKKFVFAFKPAVTATAASIQVEK